MISVIALLALMAVDDPATEIDGCEIDILASFDETDRGAMKEYYELIQEKSEALRSSDKGFGWEIGYTTASTEMTFTYYANYPCAEATRDILSAFLETNNSLNQNPKLSINAEQKPWPID
ncbi:hypothetical protein FF098_014305 [Parvularcula flava]|uniref:Uncharacterized protein n=1 Tax=Aquisalinus luteolus TaxID=1566827 RepID=A0A8J3ES92_9PROT|nr:hypothetical protein [Aquisalinus luteolus]NHK29091.1 hypothetical protein [Aquisalinus luteolus]GGI00337.1 hypothetical protein GCM10011355_28390 [Aquisalinus luteolus]